MKHQRRQSSEELQASLKREELEVRRQEARSREQVARYGAMAAFFNKLPPEAFNGLCASDVLALQYPQQ